MAADKELPALPRREQARKLYLELNLDPDATGPTTLGDVAALLGLSAKTVKKWSGMEHPTWSEQLELQRRKLSTRTVNQVLSRAAVDEATIRLEHASLADKLIALGMKRINLLLSDPHFIPTAEEAVLLIRLGMETQRTALGIGKEFDLASLATKLPDGQMSDDTRTKVLARLADAIAELQTESNIKVINGKAAPAQRARNVEPPGA